MTPKEFDLLLMMVSKRGAVISREEIGQVHLGKIRSKSPPGPGYPHLAAALELGDSRPHETVGKERLTASIPNYYSGGFGC